MGVDKSSPTSGALCGFAVGVCVLGVAVGG